ncbi:MULTISPECIES: alanine--tRNA ligase [Diaphorobacter]|uniref:Alanine--tRNA ligase n=2 Tax=Comamonadaceae TaxID=80864 RepID=SYA_ACISJ|nr:MULTISPECIES: alanine--tRNA ligase [Diaphorobacter]A1W7D0.1 RecName: Full=Alanine--tRNA ligase; AltName: Full=Alanyl-tRNA synthetase; Short=AlaRS [Acidovorax sp. JS42]ABM42155.1 alanyl-tRNA synthetase [Acidovorax sp. JS42]QYY24045.1 alanine--tRNA ligase [Diaphorobacter sp. MNS-0]UOB03934.1 alanine--tRNA ligase [Diaphorobacter sp. LI3]
MSTPTFSVADIRKTFLDFFAAKGHTVVASSPLVPGNDPTLMFTNSGMVQFKDVFLGTDKRPYVRATSVQTCLRAGGKHNDLENVGYTARHHTFFEMLGNWSFGDYFKRESLKWAWELLTEVYKLPPERLLATVYAEDDEAYDIWTKEIGLPPERVIRIGDNKGGRYKSDNFWMMADTGPCGPCSEIFYDHGEHIAGGPPGSPDEDGDRFIEIWNNVFMQFDMDEQGNVKPLPAPCVDTGMGLERLAAILQHVHSNYEIDLFDALIKAAARETGTSDLTNPSLKVIADHIRATAFLVADGVIPSNEGRGYVQRRIVRRAIRHGYKLGRKTPFFHKLVQDLVQQMGDAYPKIREQQARITDVLRVEEERFFETLAHGMEILDSALAGGAKTLPGDVAFKLHDTYGFPLDLTNDVCRERGVNVDEAGFATAMEHQKSTARAAGKFKMDRALEYTGAANQFTGYEQLAESAKIVALYVDGTSTAALHAGQSGVVVLDRTPFYAESGGQVGDQGTIGAGSACFTVADTQKIKADVYGHHGTLEAGTLNVGDTVQAQVDLQLRAATMRNHSVTHLMHKALREVLGDHVQQKGSLVNAERTRFDFAHNAPLTAAQIREIERLVNAEVLANTDTNARLMDIESAQKTGAMMLFGEKYGETVRVLDIGTSRELCGGTHVRRTGDIGLFKVVAEGGVAAGVRRIEAVTGENALAYLQSLESTVDQAAAALKAPPAELTARIGGALDQIKTLEKELAALKGKLASSQGDELAGQAVDVKGIKVLAARLEGADAKTLRETMDKLKDKLKTAAIVLAAVDGDKVQLAAGVTADSIGRVKAGDLVNFVAAQVGGKGGGKPDMAMAGGTNAAALPQALAAVQGWVGERI